MECERVELDPKTNGVANVDARARKIHGHARSGYVVCSYCLHALVSGGFVLFATMTVVVSVVFSGCG